MRTLTFSALAFALSTLAVQAGDRPVSTAAPSAHANHAAAFEACAKACDDCARICNTCAVHCAKMVSEGKKDHMKTLATCADCATICSSASSVVAKGGPFSDLICAACAEACKRCGDACEQHKDDAMMKKCMEECRKCETACREMMKHAGPMGNASR